MALYLEADQLKIGADVLLSRGAANRLDLATGDSLNIVSGSLSFGGTPLFTSGELAGSIIPTGDNTLVIGTNSRRVQEFNGSTFKHYTNVGDAQPAVQISGAALNLGPGGATAYDVTLSRGAANRLDLATGDTLNIVSGSLSFGGTPLFTSGQLAAHLTPDGDRTRDLGTGTNEIRAVYMQYGYWLAAAGDVNPAITIDTTAGIRFGPGGASALDVQLSRGAANRLDLASGDSFNIVSGSLMVAGTAVVGTQGAAVADASGGAVIDSQARTAINDLLARLRAHGLIAT